MKNVTLISLLLCSIFLFGQSKLDYNPSDWSYHFVDDFDTYNNNIDNLIISDRYSTRSSSCKEPEKGFLRGYENISIDPTNNYLVMSVTPEQSPPDCGAANYKGSRLFSNIKVSPSPCHWIDDGLQYGIFEIRAKLPSKNGTISAWWTYNAIEELDIFEFIKRDGPTSDYFQTNFHDWTGGIENFDNDGYIPIADHQGIHYNCPRKHTFTRNLSNEFHTYTMVWTPSQISYFIDGRELRTETRLPVWICPTEFVLSHRKVQSTSSLTYSEFIIDYIRIGHQTSLDAQYMYDYDNKILSEEHDVFCQVNALDADSFGDNVFFRNRSTNWMEHYYNPGNGWVHGPLPKNNINWKVNGDLAVVDEGNQVFYRGQDGRLQNYWYNGKWHHDYIDDNWRTSRFKVSSNCGALDIGKNRIFYRGTDNIMKYFEWNGNDWISNEMPISDFKWLVDGDIAVSPEGNQVFYRGQDGRLQNYWYNGEWHHGYIDFPWYPLNQKVSSACGSIALGNGRVFYRGQNDKMHLYTYTASGWEHSILPLELEIEKVTGDIDIAPDGKVFYRGADFKIQMYYEEKGHWYHMWVNETETTSKELINDCSPIIIKNNNVLFYSNSLSAPYTYNKKASSGQIIDPECTVDVSTNLHRHIEFEKKDRYIETDIHISPNPVTDQFTIKWENMLNNSDMEFTIFDATGKSIKSRTTKGCYQTEFDLSGFPNGIYLLQIKNEQKLEIIKLIKL